MRKFIDEILVKFYLDDKGKSHVMCFYPSLKLYFFNDVDLTIPARSL